MSKIKAYKLANNVLINESVYDFLVEQRELDTGVIDIDRSKKKSECEITIDMLEGLDEQDL